jgi:toxin CptA
VKPLHVTLHASYRLLIVLVLAGVFFSAMCLLLPAPLWLKALLVLVVLVLVAYSSLRYALLRWPNAVVALHVNKSNQLQLVLNNGQQVEMMVQANTVVTAYLTVLNCVAKEASLVQTLFTTSIVILPDAVDAENFRQLRVWLRWAKLASAQTAALDSAEDKTV